MQMQTVTLGNVEPLVYTVRDKAGNPVDATGGVTFTVEDAAGAQTSASGAKTATGVYEYDWQPPAAGLYTVYAASLNPNTADRGQVNVLPSLL